MPSPYGQNPRMTAASGRQQRTPLSVWAPEVQRVQLLGKFLRFIALVKKGKGLAPVFVLASEEEASSPGFSSG